MANKNLSTYDDQIRLIKKIEKYKEEFWKEINEVSGNDPKYTLRCFIYEALDKLLIDIDTYNDKLG